MNFVGRLKHEFIRRLSCFQQIATVLLLWFIEV